MRIHVAGALETGPTNLAAFDSCLYTVGVGNNNLIRLSSVIPPGAEIVESSPPVALYGDRVYLVYAHAVSASYPVAAGVGWVQNPDGSGLFVEHEFVGNDAYRMVKDLIRTSLRHLCDIRGLPDLDIKDHIVSGGPGLSMKPTSAFVAAVYKSEPW